MIENQVEIQNEDNCSFSLIHGDIEHRKSVVNEICHNKELNKDVGRRTASKKQQNRYNKLLKNCPFNRMVKDFVTGRYGEAGNHLQYKYKLDNVAMKNLIKYIYGFNFNHTLSPLYMNYHNKINTIKTKKIMSKHKSLHDDYYYLVTLTSPSLEANITDVDTLTDINRKGNEKINNLFKVIKKEFDVDGIIKKFEMTFNYVNGKAMYHPHYHLLISFPKECFRKYSIEKDGVITVKSLSTRIFEYWHDNYLMEYFHEVTENSCTNKSCDRTKCNGNYAKEYAKDKYCHEKCNVAYTLGDYRAAYDFRRAYDKNLAKEIAGYISKATLTDHLKTQEIFDFAYKFFHRKRVLTFLGSFKAVNKLLKLDDEEIEDDEAEYSHTITFYWYKGKYNLDIIKKLDVTGFREDRPSGLDNSTSTRKECFYS